MALAIDLGALARRLRERGPPGAACVSLVDSTGRIAARSRDHERFLGQVAPSWPLLSAARAQPTSRASSVYGEDALFAAIWLRSAPGWVIAVAEPPALHQAR